MPENNEQEQQELLYRFSMFQRQIEELQQQIEAVERGIIDLTSLNYGLDELIGGVGKEIFAPFGKGIFVRAKLLSEDLNVDVGGGNFVKKSIPETKDIIKEQMGKLSQIKGELEHNLEEIGEEVTKVMNQAQSQEEKHEHNHNHNHEED